MTDRLSKTRRSENMRRIRSKDTSPEMTIRRLLHGLGYRYRLHVKTLPGKPDLVFPSRGCVLMVHGCFWHGHPGCRESKTPQTNQDYWIGKLQKNRDRDRRHLRALRRLGWRVMVIWECQTEKLETIQSRILRFLG
ncbi:MAG: DNA mismatch endonuclease Vsr [Bryobacterales bacterium]|nr:DNA mismatch endonuclease Vsr [Bryobacterales bacterium]